MSQIKENEIYPKFEFRLSHEEKEWLQAELNFLKEKFRHTPAVSQGDLLMAALRQGFRYLREREKL